MPVFRQLTTKDVALTVCFTALYAVLASIPIFQILGMPNRSITAAAVVAPIIGVLLGPYVGVLSTALGGTIGFFNGSFSPPSFVSGVATALCAGLLYKGKRIWCAMVYLLFLAVFGFYPYIGPAWLFPPSMWFQIVGFIILVSPLQTMATQNLKSNNNARFFFAFFIISLVATLAGQISGSLTFMLISPVPADGWMVLWQGLTFLYPVERMMIGLVSALIGAPLLKVLRKSNLESLTAK
jgi:hypothetical protein